MLNAILVGCGGISDAWLTALRETPVLAQTIRLAGFVDLDLATARARAAKHGYSEAHCSTDLAAMLDSLKPEIVFDLVVPPARHDVVQQALAAGAHVLSEKPMANSLDEARALIAAADSAGLRHAVIQNRRFLPGIRRAKSLIDSGAIGELTAVHSDFFLGAHFGGFREQMRHVLLLDMSIHTFDAARYLIGAVPEAVYCRESNPKGSWYAQGASADALFDFAGGVTASYRGSWCAEGANTAWEASWRIIGTKGTLLWDGNDVLSAHVVVGDEGFIRPLATLEIPAAPELIQGHAGVIADFVHAIQSGQPPLTEGRDNIQSLAMVTAAIESAETGQRQAITFR
jgi:predicted dehydrogenase